MSHCGIDDLMNAQAIDHVLLTKKCGEHIHFCDSTTYDHIHDCDVRQSISSIQSLAPEYIVHETLQFA